RHQLPLGRTQCFLGPPPLQTEAELPGDRDGEIDFDLVKGMRSGVVRHKLADQFTINYERKESCGSNAFGLDCRLQRTWKIGGINIRNADWLRIPDFACPRRVTLDRPPVLLGKSSPSDQAHHPRVVEKKDAPTLAAQDLANRLEGCVVDLLEGGSAEQPIRERIELRLLVPVSGDGLFCKFTVSYVDRHVDRADHGAGTLEKWGRVGDETSAGAVRTLDDALHAADRTPFLHSRRHRALVVGHWRTVGPQ